MARQRIADQGERAHVELLMHAAKVGRHAVAQPAAVAELAHQRSALRVDVVAMSRREFAAAPRLELLGELPVAIVEERPVEEGAIRHQSPWNTGFCFAA